MWVVADVYEPDVPRVRRGQRVAVTLPCCPNDRFEGPIDYISDIVDKDTRTVKVRAVVPNRGRALKAEMFVKVAIAPASAACSPCAERGTPRGRPDLRADRARQGRLRTPAGAARAELNGSVEVRDGVTPEDRVVAAEHPAQESRPVIARLVAFGLHQRFVTLALRCC